MAGTRQHLLVDMRRPSTSTAEMSSLLHDDVSQESLYINRHDHGQLHRHHHRQQQQQWSHDVPSRDVNKTSSVTSLPAVEYRMLFGWPATINVSSLYSFGKHVTCES